MKKTLTVMLLSLFMGATVITTASAGWWGRGPDGGRGQGYGPGNCGGPCACRGADDDLDKARREFRSQTREQRQLLWDKKEAYRELMRQSAPNKEEAAKLWSEIFDLQTKLHQMAMAAGVAPEGDDDDGQGNGSGPRCGNGFRGGCDGPRGGCGRGCDGPRGGYGRGCDGPRGGW